MCLSVSLALPLLFLVPYTSFVPHAGTLREPPFIEISLKVFVLYNETQFLIAVSKVIVLTSENSRETGLTDFVSYLCIFFSSKISVQKEKGAAALRPFVRSVLCGLGFPLFDLIYMVLGDFASTSWITTSPNSRP